MKNQDKKIVTFSVEDSNISAVNELNDSQFSLLKIKFFSDAITSHGYKCSAETLKRCAYTILEKPILVNYSILRDKFLGHEDSEIPCGFVPKNSTIEFETDENGVTYVIVSAYIWSMYFDYIMNVFENQDGKSDVSVELLVVESEDKDNYTEMLNLCFTAITLIGMNPACKGANATVLKFSEEEQDKYLQAKQLFEQTLYNSDTQLNKVNITQESTTLLENEDSFLNCSSKNEPKEENMSKKVLENSTDMELVANSDSSTVEPTKVDNAEQRIHTRTTEEIDINLYNDEGHYIGSSSEYSSKSTTKVEEITEEEANTKVETILNSDDSEEIDYKAKFAEMEVKCSALETEKVELQTKYSALELKCSTLETYKNNKENELKVHAVECAIDEVTDILSAEQLIEWRSKSVNCTDVNQFKNELKAFAFDIQKNSGIKPQDPLRNAIPKTSQVTSDNVWDRLASL